MASFLSFLAFSGSVEAVCRPKSGYPSADAPQLGLECRFLVATATRLEIQSQKGFLQCTIGEVCTKKTKTVASNFVRRKDGDRQLRSSQMLLVVFLHHRALLSLPQSSYSTNTSSSRAVCASATRSVPPWLVLRSIAHVSCFQSRLRMSILSMVWVSLRLAPIMYSPAEK